MTRVCSCSPTEPIGHALEALVDTLETFRRLDNEKRSNDVIWGKSLIGLILNLLNFQGTLLMRVPWRSVYI